MTSAGWPSVKEKFFDWDVFVDTFPDIARAFWLDIRVFVTVEIAVLILGLIVALVRVTTSPALFPGRLIAFAYTLFRGIPSSPARLPRRLPGSRGCSSPGCQPSR